MLAVVAPVTVWLALAADQVAGTLVGADFRAGVSLLLPVLAVARMLGVLNQFHLQISFQLAERPFLSVMQSCLTLVLGVVSMFLLIPKFGLLGAALATLITEAVGLVVAIYLTRRAFPLPFDMQRVAAVFASALTMGCAIYVAKLGVGGTGLLSLVQRQPGRRARLCRRGMAVRCRASQDVNHANAALARSDLRWPGKPGWLDLATMRPCRDAPQAPNHQG